MSDDTLFEEIAAEVNRQDGIHPDGYPATRDGVFLGITTAVHELDREAIDAWRAARCKCPAPHCGHHDWSRVRIEVIQAAAVLLRMIRSIDATPHQSDCRPTRKSDAPTEGLRDWITQWFA